MVKQAKVRDWALKYHMKIESKGFLQNKFKMDCKNMKLEQLIYNMEKDKSIFDH